MERESIDLPDGRRYVGEVDEDGLPHGRGVLTWKEGDRYEGEFRSGRMVGHGTYRWPDGSSYTGEHGAEETRGVYTWPDGSQFEGTFRGGQPAAGVLTGADGTVARGEFGTAREGFELQGEGAFLLPDGTMFTCNAYRDGQAEGLGSARLPSGARYEGAYRSGRAHGQGVKTWPDGHRYEGAFVEGKGRVSARGPIPMEAGTRGGSRMTFRMGAGSRRGRTERGPRGSGARGRRRGAWWSSTTTASATRASGATASRTGKVSGRRRMDGGTPARSAMGFCTARAGRSR